MLCDLCVHLFVPQPRRATHTARVAVLRADQARDDMVRENVPRPEPRHALVEAIDVRQPAAEHDDVRIDEVDDAAERARHAIFVSFEGRDRQRVAPTAARAAISSAVMSGCPGLSKGSRAPAPAPTETSRCNRFARNSRRPGDSTPRAAGSGLCPHSPPMALAPTSTCRSITTPPPVPVPMITPNTTRAPAAAPSVASDSAKQLASLAKRTGRSSRRDSLRQRRAVQPGRIGVLDQPGRRRDRAGDPDADGAGLTDLLLDLAHEAGDRAQRARVVASRRCDPPPQPLVPVAGDRDPFDLGAAQVDADPHACGHRISQRKIFARQ